jgi:hypothetical protein
MNAATPTWTQIAEFESTGLSSANLQEFGSYISLTYSEVQPNNLYLYVNSLLSGQSGGILSRFKLSITEPVAPKTAPTVGVLSDFFLDSQLYISGVDNDTLATALWPVSGIIVQYKLSTGSEWTTATGSSMNSRTLQCLRPGTNYVVRAAFVNEYGQGPWSAEVPLGVSNDGSTIFHFFFFFFFFND